MAIRTVITHGYGAGASIGAIVVRGYSVASVAVNQNRVKRIEFSSASAQVLISAKQQAVSAKTQSIVTRGYGLPGNISSIPTRGYLTGVAAVSIVFDSVSQQILIVDGPDFVSRLLAEDGSILLKEDGNAILKEQE